MPRIAAADASVRLPDKTSERTSMRCNSFPLIVKSPNLRLRNCRKGSLDISTLQKPDISTLRLHSTIRVAIHKMHYRKSSEVAENPTLRAVRAVGLPEVVSVPPLQLTGRDIYPSYLKDHDQFSE